MRPSCCGLENFDCDHCADRGFGFQRQLTTGRLYKFPRTIGGQGPVPLLFVGINPRRSASNAKLHELVASDLNAFDELARNRACGEAYISTNGREKHYRTHARIAKAAFAGTQMEGTLFESVAACTDAFLCATEDATPEIAEALRNGGGPCVDRHFWKTLNQVQPRVVIAVGKLVFDFLSRYCNGAPPRLNVASKPALLAIPHPSNRTLPLAECDEIGGICRAIMSCTDNGAALSYVWDRRVVAQPRTRRTGNTIERDIDWSAAYGWKPHHHPADLEWLEGNLARKIQYRLIKGGTCRYVLELDAAELRGAIGKYVDGSHWNRTGYVNPITVFRGRKPTEVLKPAWRPFAREKASLSSSSGSPVRENLPIRDQADGCGDEIG